VKWVVALPDFADPVQFSRFDKSNPLEGYFALYDRKSKTMVLFGFRG
jgi:hypothetical protein